MLRPQPPAPARATRFGDAIDDASQGIREPVSRENP